MIDQLRALDPAPAGTDLPRVALDDVLDRRFSLREESAPAARRRSGLAAAAVAAAVTGLVVWIGGDRPDALATRPAGSEAASEAESERFWGVGPVPGFSVFLDPAASEREIAAVRVVVESDRRVRAWRFISKADAHAEFVRMLQASPEMVAAVGPEAMPPSFQVALVDPSDRVLERELRDVDGVREVVALADLTEVREWTVVGDELAADRRRTTETTPAGSFAYPADCGAVAHGKVATAYLRPNAGERWTSSPSGTWLAQRLARPRFADPIDAGSAWVVAHGIDGVLFAWVGPADDLGGMSAAPLASRVVEPAEPYPSGQYRLGRVWSTAAGNARLWFLLAPRNAQPPLDAAPPCLPADAEIEAWIADALTNAEANPFEGSLPATAGRVAVDADFGGPSTRWLDAAVSAVGFELPGNLEAVEVPSSTHSSRYGTDSMFATERTTIVVAGGLEMRLRQPDNRRIDLAPLAALEAELNRNPFIGQPAG